MKTDWKLLLPYYPNIATHIPDYGYETEFPLTTINSIFEQLKGIIGQRNVFYVENELDDSIWKEIRNGTHRDDHIIGTITEVAKNVRGYSDPTHHIYAKVETDSKYDRLPLDRAYSLNIGLDSFKNIWAPYETGPDNWCPLDYKKPFVVTDCVVKGLYFKTLKNHNWDEGRLQEYYSLMGLGMYMMIPGRCYW